MSRFNDSYVSQGAEKVHEKDLSTLVDRADEIIKRSRHGALRQYLDDVRLLVKMTRDWVSGRYRSVPWATISAIAFALLYVLNPFDVIPDLLPLVGLTDDAAVLTICLAMTQRDVAAYRAWLEASAKNTPPPPLEKTE